MRRGEKVPPAQNLEGARAKGPAGAPADTLATLLQEHQDVLLRRRILVEADPDGEGARGAAAPAGPTPDGAADAAGLHPYFARAHALDDLSALCLSGGGIRSAAFALGAIQSLARRQLLHRFDYLSTVSGGGYIGSWLMSWVQRRGYEAVLAGLRSDREPDRTSPLAYLWRYSNYLTPHTGLFSADTLTIVALYVRNLLLNWLVIMPLILSAIALAKLAALTAWGIDPAHAGTLAMLAITLVGSALLDFLLQRPGWENMRSTRLAFWMTNLLPMLLGSFLASVAGIKYLAIVEYVDPPWPSIAVTLSLAGALICALAWLLAFYFARLSPRAGEPGARVPAPSVRTTVASASREDPVIGYVAWAAVSYALSGIVFGLVLTGILWLLHGPVEALAPLRPNGPSDLRGLLLVCFGPAIVVGAIFFGELIYVGLTSDAPWADAEREWLARAGGHYAFVAWIWAAGFVVVLGGSAVVGSFAFPNAVGWFAGSGGAAAILIALLGKASSTAAFVRDEIKTWKNLSARFVLAIVTPVFIVCLLALLSAGFDWIVFGKAGVVLPSEAASAASPLSLLAWFFGILVFGLAISRFVNINRFSLHSVYRNRLIRTFLGASRRDRAPNPFTGFDERDNIALQDLWPQKPAEPGKLPPQLLVANIALNVLKGKDLAFQERRALPLTATARAVGSGNLPWIDWTDTQRIGCYRPSRDYARGRKGAKGMTLGTAMTLSGAAASPNMGYHSSPTLSLLLTLFNVRLGGWLGNPGPAGTSSFTLSGPKIAAKPLVYEALGLANDYRKFVYLSDGGHFENLGLYEMIRRRCRSIVVCDAGCDPKCTFEDLGNAIRRISLDFGVRIEFEALDIKPRTAQPPGMAYAAVADIIYPERPDLPGKLLYLKPGFLGGEPAAARSYGEIHPEFPHETTVDQWFGESQFEAYRALGEYVMDRVVGEDAVDAKDGIGAFIATASRHLARQRGGAPAPPPQPPRRPRKAQPRRGADDDSLRSHRERGTP